MLSLSSASDTDWQQLLTGGDETPTLEFRKSHVATMATKVTWDVDSFLARLNCLSACRGIRFSLYPKMSWNIKGNLHVKIQGCVLHQATHVRLGCVLDGESYSLYAVFPNLGKGSRKTTYLRTEEHQTWVDQIFLPSIYEHCPFDVTQHFPRSLLIRLVLGRRNRCGKQRRTISTLTIPYQRGILPESGNRSTIERQ
jgi:hypothetical protein